MKEYMKILIDLVSSILNRNLDFQTAWSKS
jgi:hypothetical protein